MGDAGIHYETLAPRAMLPAFDKAAWPLKTESYCRPRSAPRGTARSAQFQNALYAANSQLYVAVSRGAVEEVKRVLQGGTAELESKHLNDITAMHKAAQRGDVEMLRALIELRANVDARDSLGQAPLHHAAQQSHVGAVQILLRTRAQADLADKEGMTPARCAALQIHARSVDRKRLALCLDFLSRALDAELLVLRKRQEVLTEPEDAGASGDATPQPLFGRLESAPSTPPRVRSAASPGYPRSLFTSPDTATGATTPRSSRPVSASGYRGTPERRGLLEIMSDEDRFRSNYFNALAHGQSRVVENMLKMRACAASENESGTPALHVAAMGAHPQVVQLLLRHRADLAHFDRQGMSALRAAAGNLHRGSSGGDAWRVACVLDALLRAQEQEVRLLRSSVACRESAAKSQPLT